MSLRFKVEIVCNFVPFVLESTEYCIQVNSTTLHQMSFFHKICLILKMLKSNLCVTWIKTAQLSVKPYNYYLMTPSISPNLHTNPTPQRPLTYSDNNSVQTVRAHYLAHVFFGATPLPTFILACLPFLAHIFKCIAIVSPSDKITPNRCKGYRVVNPSSEFIARKIGAILS